MSFLKKIFSRGKAEPDANKNGVASKPAEREKAPAPQTRGEEGARDLTGIRYALEHRVATRAFFENAEGWLHCVLEGKLYTVWEDIFRQNGAQIPYKPEQFGVHTMRTDRDTILVCQTLPEPERMPLCHRVFFLLNLKDQSKAYYTVEKTMGEGKNCLCQWTQEGAHANLGAMPISFSETEHPALRLMAEFRHILKISGREDEKFLLPPKQD